MDEQRAPNDGLRDAMASLLSPEYRDRTPTPTLLAVLVTARAGLDNYEGQLVALARSEGYTWDEIGGGLDVPRQTAHRRWSHVG